MSFEEFEEQKNCEIHFASQKVLGLVEMTSDLVNASFILLEWQAVKMIFFAPCSPQRSKPACLKRASAKAQ